MDVVAAVLGIVLFGAMAASWRSLGRAPGAYLRRRGLDLPDRIYRAFGLCILVVGCLGVLSGLAQLVALLV